VVSAGKSDYDASKILVLDGLEAVRKRPGMYIGGVGKDGLHHLVFEIIDNSVDEALSGYCKNINVTIKNNNFIIVEDDGRGIPVGQHKSGKNSLELVLTTLHSGGKFGGDLYKVSGGLHGVGLSVVNALSEKLCVQVKRDGKIYCQEYERGKPICPIKIVGNTKKTGTTIIFRPDYEIFEENEFDKSVILEKLQHISFLVPGLKTTLKDEKSNEIKSFYYKNGILDFIKEYKSDKVELACSDYYFFKSNDNNIEFELVFKLFDSEDVVFYTYVNCIKTSRGGTHLDGFKKGFYKAVKEYFSNSRKYRDKKIEIDDVIYGIFAILSVKVKNPQFEGQTKSKLNNAEVGLFVEQSVYSLVKELVNSNKKIGKVIIELALKSYELRLASSRVRRSVINQSGLKLSSKLADCSSDEVENRELFIVEGDSAGGTAKQARNRRFQAVLPIKGKILNIEKRSYKKILENEEIKKILSAIGINKISKDGMTKEDLKNIRYGKIIIMTDADVDGAHIRTLLLTLFYRYMRPLIEEGKVYVALPPLFAIKTNKDTIYCWDHDELTGKIKEIINKNEKAKIHIQRYKGLGEMNPEQLFETTMDPNKRKLIQLLINDQKEVEETIKILMGKEISDRKKFIEANAGFANIDI